MRIPLFAASAAILSLFISGCAEPRITSVHDLTELRDYTFQSTVAEPQAQWNPDNYQIIARSIKGFALYEEGAVNPFLSSQEKRESCFPCWINHKQFVFGPQTLMLRTAAGIVPNSQGLTVVTIGGDTRTISNRGFRPRIWNEVIVAQDQDHIIAFDKDGVVSEFAPGFFAEPQRVGPGICFLDRPVTETDHWSGYPQRRGKLIIRWDRKTVTEVPNAIEPRWTADGGVVATVLRDEPPANGPWWQGGTDLIYIANDEARPTIIATNVRSAAPHPKEPLVAAVDNRTGALVFCNLLKPELRRYADHGDHPQWSYDGVRLVAEEPVVGKADQKTLHVYVFKLTKPAP